jgi:hypothetical protein
MTSDFKLDGQLKISREVIHGAAKLGHELAKGYNCSMLELF